MKLETLKKAGSIYLVPHRLRMKTTVFIMKLTALFIWCIIPTDISIVSSLCQVKDLLFLVLKCSFHIYRVFIIYSIRMVYAVVKDEWEDFNGVHVRVHTCNPWYN